MNKNNFQSGIATLVGFLFLIGAFYFIVANFIGPENQKSALITGYVFLISMGLYFWIGPGEKRLGLSSASQWSMMFVIALVLTSIFFLMDCGTGFSFRSQSSSCMAGTRGLGFMFTLVAAGFTLVTLAGIIRAIVLNLLLSLK